MKITDRTARKCIGNKYESILVFPKKSLNKVMDFWKKEHYPYSYHSNPEISQRYVLYPRNNNIDEGYYMGFENNRIYNSILKYIPEAVPLDKIEEELKLSTNGLDSVFKSINFDMADSI